MELKIALFLFALIFFAPCVVDSRFIPNRSRTFVKVPDSKLFFSPRSLEGTSFGAQNTTNTNDSNHTPHLVTVRLKGDTELGYYYVTLFFGTPLQKQTLIVDTGSVTTTIPCVECGNNCGQHHFDKPFDHSASETFQSFKCDENFGNYVCSDCTNMCYFSVSYVEGSSYRGHFNKDYVSFGNEIEDFFDLLKPKSDTTTEDPSEDEKSQYQKTHVEEIARQRKTFMPFGCTDIETKLFYDQEADGILGLGVNTNARSSPPNLLDVIHMNNPGFRRDFSLCLAQTGGYFTVGGHNTAYHEATEKITYTEFFDEYGQYRVYLKHIEMNGKDIGLNDYTLNHGEGAFFDSGTTMTHVPKETYDALTRSLSDYCNEDSNHCGKGSAAKNQKLCWNYHSEDFETLQEFLNSFPTFKFYFGKNGKGIYEWKGEDYLYQKPGSSKMYCMGLSRYDRETILGGTFMKNHDILFDKQNKRIGFIRANCSAVNEESFLTYPQEQTNQTLVNSSNSSSSVQPQGEISSTTTFVVQPVPEGNKIIVSMIVVTVIIGIIAAIVGGYIIYRRKKNPKYSNMQNDIELPNSKAPDTSFDGIDQGGPSHNPIQGPSDSQNTINSVYEI